MSYHKTDPMNMIAKLLMNSLYGRFAMKPIKNIQGFFSKDEFFKIGKEFNIIDYIEFLDKDNKCSIFVNYENPNILDNDTKVSISIASAVTAYSRVKMSEYKKGGYNLYYTDTDSGYFDKPLPDHLIGTELGKLKLEYIFKEVVFLSPKVYGGITNEGEEIVKVKGYKNPLSYWLLKSLLIKDTKLELYHDKWYKSMSKGEIEIKPDSIYTLIATENKREFVYEGDKIIGTRPYVINFKKTINN
jgi:DNA polymerase type B, organellar and viral